jgi:Flp pilus assembly protein TadG
MSRPQTRRSPGDAGSAGVETALAVLALLSMTFFVVGGLRITNTNGDVSAAARAGARAAATAGNASSASADASSVVNAMLASRGVACVGGPSTSVSGAGAANSLVRVTVTCTVSLGDVVLGGFPGFRSVSASAIEYTDSVRGF